MPVVPGTGVAKLDETMELTAARARRAWMPRSSSPRTTRAPRRRRCTSGTDGRGEFPELPIVAYNVPSRTAVDIAPETVARLFRDVENFVGIKETTKDFEHFSRVIQLCGRELLVWSGIELLCLPLLALGGAGFLSATANIAPAAVAQDVRAVGGGRLAGAREIHYGLHPLVDLLFVETNPAPGKWVLEQRGLIRSGYVRPPLIPPTEAGLAKMRAYLPRASSTSRRSPACRSETHRPTAHHVPERPADPHPALHRRPVRRRVGGETFDVLDPVSNQIYMQAAAGQKADVDAAVAAATRAFTDGPVAADAAPGARPGAEPDRRLGRGAGRPARRAGVLRHRPADHPGARPGAARRRELPVLRRPDRRPGRRHLQGARAGR